MLTYLAVQNLALVESAALDLSPHLNTLTGESGSGKSILLDALAFVAGIPKTRTQIRVGASQAQVEALFVIDAAQKAQLDPLFASLDLPLEEEIVLSRRLDSSGRSRCFVQGALVPRSTLAEVSSQLIEFSDQGDSHALKNPLQQLKLLDSCAGLTQQAATFHAAYETYRLLSQELDQAKKTADELERRRDFLEFQLNELESCRAREYTEAEQKLEALEDARAIHEFSRAFLEELAWSDRSLLDRLRHWEKRSRNLPHEEDGSIGVALEALERLVETTERLDAAHPFEEAEVTKLEELVRGVRDLARKHRVPPEALEEKTHELRRELERTDSCQGELIELELRKKQLEQRVDHLAKELHEARREAANELNQRVPRELEALGLPGAHLFFQLSETNLGPSGITQLELSFASHPGAELRPLGRSASGGELGRVLLALRLATKARRPLLVLDEIDAGAGGHAAEKIGASLSRATAHGQILCVTHWPQVACLAEKHWLVQKGTIGDVLHSTVRLADEPLRVDELCRMLGGSLETARPHAEAMRNAARLGLDSTPPSPPARTSKKNKIHLVSHAA